MSANNCIHASGGSGVVLKSKSFGRRRMMLGVGRTSVTAWTNTRCRKAASAERKNSLRVYFNNK